MKVVGEFIRDGCWPDRFLEKIEMARSRGLKLVLIDITASAGFEADRTSVMTRYETCERLANALPSGFKMALLAKPEQIRADRFGETVMVNRGARVRVTTDLNEALQWFGMTPVDKPVGTP
jgi:hypothetical protein